jgi:membrane protein involved in colicin uptake
LLKQLGGITVNKAFVEKRKAEAAALKAKANADQAIRRAKQAANNARAKANREANRKAAEARKAKENANRKAAELARKVKVVVKNSNSVLKARANAIRKVSSQRWRNNASAAYNLYARIPGGTSLQKSNWIKQLAASYVNHAERVAKAKSFGMGGSKRHRMPGNVNYVDSWHRNRMNAVLANQLIDALRKLNLNLH